MRKSAKLRGRWAIIGVSVLISSLQLSNVNSVETESVGIEERKISQQTSGITEREVTGTECVTKSPSLMDVLLNVRSNASDVVSRIGNVSSENDSTLADAGPLRPKCDEISGCNVPLHCFDFKQLSNSASVIPDPPQPLLVTPHQLEGILEDTAVQNSCAVVLFYAPWCTFSVQFARKFNALGRSFDGLAVLAVDLAENEPYKYILAYLPLVAFYYRGKTLLKFSLDSSFEDLRDAVANITGFQPLEVNLTDPENDWPVPTHRDTSDQLFLTLSVWWVLFIGLVYSMKSTRLRRFCRHCLRTKHRHKD